MSANIIYAIIVVVAILSLLLWGYPRGTARSAKTNVTDKGLPKPNFTPPPMPRVKQARVYRNCENCKYFYREDGLSTSIEECGAVEIEFRAVDTPTFFCSEWEAHNATQ